MEINFKYFQLSSIKFQSTKFKYSNRKKLYFDNHFQNYEIAKKIIKEIKQKLKSIKDIKDINQLKNNYSKWEILDTNSSIEILCIVLMNYGFNRDFIIQKIFEGNVPENINDPNEEVQELLLSNKNSLFKIPISSYKINKERFFILVKKDIVYPLFIDVNHHLYGEQYLKYDSKFKIEILWNYFFNKLDYFI